MLKRGFWRTATVLALTGVFFGTGSVFAANTVTDPLCQQSGTGSSTYCQQTGENPIVGKDSIITKVINFLSMIAGAAAVLMIVVSGFRFVTSHGESGNIKAARETLMYALVGLVIVIFAQTIVKFVLDKV